jgi:L-amino acid N-acyltransferase YncA
MDVVIRPAVTDDLEPIAEIYAHHVLTGVATSR